MNRRQERLQLTSSAPVAAYADGELIENLDIKATGEVPGIAVVGRNNVRIRNCRIQHNDVPGINAVGAGSLLVEDCQIICASAPTAGALTTSEAVNIRLDDCERTTLHRIRVERGASGVYAHRCSRLQIGMLEGYDFRGPFPRGQLVQFDKCQKVLLEDFSCENSGATSWTEDNINCFGCVDPVVRRGFIHGNNSPSGVGVLIENGEGGQGGLVQDVDVVYWANGAFSATEGAKGVVFERCRARDGLGPEANSTSFGKTDYLGRPIPSLQSWLGNLDRGQPMSGQEAFFAFKVGKPDIVFRDCSYANLPKAPLLAWDQDQMAVAEFREVDFTPRGRLSLVFPWSADAVSPAAAELVERRSRIDPSKPEDGLPASKADLRRNLQVAKEEIERLQSMAASWRLIEADHRLTPDDFGRILVVDSARSIAIICPGGLHGEKGVSYSLKVMRFGEGSVYFQPEGDLRLMAPSGRLGVPERYGVATLHLLDGQTAILEGV